MINWSISGKQRTRGEKIWLHVNLMVYLSLARHWYPAKIRHIERVSFKDIKYLLTIKLPWSSFFSAVSRIAKCIFSQYFKLQTKVALIFQLSTNAINISLPINKDNNNHHSHTRAHSTQENLVSVNFPGGRGFKWPNFPLISATQNATWEVPFSFSKMSNSQENENLFISDCIYN